MDHPKPLPIVAIDHIQITVPPGQEETARHFYSHILGLPEVPKPPSLQSRGGLWLQCGDRAVHIGAEDGFDRSKTKAHIAYRVTGLPAWRLHLRNHAIEILDSIPIPNCDRFEFRDPFGNRVELIEYRAE